MIGAANSSGSSITYRMAAGVWTTAQNWLQPHPVLQWMLVHPLLSIGIAVLILFLLGGLLQAIGRLTEQIWVFLFQAPLRLVQWLISLSAKLIGWGAGSGIRGRSTHDPQTRLNEILTRLEALRQEQDKLLDEVKALLTDKIV